MDDWSGYDDFDNFENESDEEDPFEWDEGQWEAFFQEEDEQYRLFEELLEKFGYSEEGFKKAFRAMGWDIPDFEDDFNYKDADEISESQDIDDILEDQYGSWEPDFLTEYEEPEENAHPLFKKLFHLIDETLYSLKNIEVKSEQDPAVTFQKGLMEAMSKLFHAGYYNLEAQFEAPQGLVLAALKRVRKSLFISLFNIPELKRKNCVAKNRLIYFHSKITDILRDVNSELSETRKD